MDFSTFLDLESAEELYNKRITRILTSDFPNYFAVVTRIRQETKSIGPESGMLSSTVVPQVQAVFPEGSLTKKIKVGLQVSIHTSSFSLDIIPRHFSMEFGILDIEYHGKWIC